MYGLRGADGPNALAWAGVGAGQSKASPVATHPAIRRRAATQVILLI
jgi:hypothetical protein